jgi:hypothetical protein
MATAIAPYSKFATHGAVNDLPEWDGCGNQYNYSLLLWFAGRGPAWLKGTPSGLVP